MKPFLRHLIRHVTKDPSGWQEYKLMVNASLKGMNGKVVWSKPNESASATNNATINVSDLQNGTYRLLVTGLDHKHIANQKIVFMY